MVNFHLKILHINTAAERGGAALIANRLHLWQRAAGYDSRLLVARGESDPHKGVIALGERRERFLLNVLFYRLLGKEGFLNKDLWAIIQPIIDESDVIHIHNAHGYYMPDDVLLKLFCKPIVWTLHDFRLATGGMASPESSKLKGKAYPIEWIDRSRLRQSFFHDLVKQFNPILVAPTHAATKQLVEIGLPANNLHTVPHGVFESESVREEIVRQELRNKFGWHKNAHIFIFASSSIDNKQKGFDVFLRAISKLPTDRKWVAYVIGGDADRSKHSVRRLGVNGVEFTGAIENRELIECFKACNTYVTATFSETYGLTVVEALGQGARVVCSDLPVLREVTCGQANFFPVGDDEALADCLRTELDVICDAVRDHRAANIRFRFSNQNMISSYARLYALAIEQWASIL